MQNLLINIEKKAKEHYKFIRCNFDFPVDLNYRNFLRDDKRYIIVVRKLNESNDIVAISVFSIYDDRINSDYTVVEKHHRRLGINTKIKSYLENIAITNYTEMITASVREFNTNSIYSLLKCGYIVSKRRFKYKNGDIKLRLFKILTY